MSYRFKNFPAGLSSMATQYSVIIIDRNDDRYSALYIFKRFYLFNIFGYNKNTKNYDFTIQVLKTLRMSVKKKTYFYPIY